MLFYQKDTKILLLSFMVTVVLQSGILDGEYSVVPLLTIWVVISWKFSNHLAT